MNKERCQYEQIVEKFFGLPETVTEKTIIKADFMLLVNLVAFAASQFPSQGLREEEKCTHDPNICRVAFCGWPHKCDEPSVPSPDLASVASHSSTVGNSIERAEELWDKYSQHIDDDLYSLQTVAGSFILTRSDYIKLITELLS